MKWKPASRISQYLICTLVKDLWKDTAVSTPDYYVEGYDSVAVDRIRIGTVASRRRGINKFPYDTAK